LAPHKKGENFFFFSGRIRTQIPFLPGQIVVKCAVALVPRPLINLKVKKVMFVFILELLNRPSSISNRANRGDARRAERKRLCTDSTEVQPCWFAIAANICPDLTHAKSLASTNAVLPGLRKPGQKETDLCDIGNPGGKTKVKRCDMQLLTNVLQLVNEAANFRFCSGDQFNVGCLPVRMLNSVRWPRTTISFTKPRGLCGRVGAQAQGAHALAWVWTVGVKVVKRRQIIVPLWPRLLRAGPPPEYSHLRRTQVSLPFCNWAIPDQQF
jgi:hypothetical protein